MSIAHRLGGYINRCPVHNTERSLKSSGSPGANSQSVAGVLELASMPAAVQIEQLDFRFSDQPVLRDINLTIERGTTLGLIGPNGGGKTTLIRLMLGLLNPTRGAIRVGGLPPAQAVRRGNVIGYLPQNPRVPGNLPLTVRQVALLGLTGKTGMLRAIPREDILFMDDLLGKVGAAEWADMPVAKLSGGQLQRVLIARALAPRPMLLLLDEPTTGIDRPGQQRFIEFLQELKAEMGLTVVFVSHDLRAVSAISDRIACLNLTLHYHDVPDHLPPDLVYRMFACDLEAMGIRDGHVCTHHVEPRSREDAKENQLIATDRAQMHTDENG